MKTIDSDITLVQDRLRDALNLSHEHTGTVEDWDEMVELITEARAAAERVHRALSSGEVTDAKR